MAVSKLQWSMAAGVLALYAGLTIAQAPDGAAKLAPPAQDRSGVRATADGTWHANHEMRLRSDGNLPGQLRSFDAAGNLAPVRARLFFLQNGQVIGRATAGEDGMFQVVGLGSGTYSVVAASPDGFGAFGLNIVAPKATVEPKVKSISKDKIREVSFAEEDVPETMTLDVSLVPPADFAAMSQIIQSQIPGFLGSGGGLAGLGGTLGGAAGGGGIGGGGGGLGGLLGAGAAIGGLGAILASSRTSSTTASSSGS